MNRVGKRNSFPGVLILLALFAAIAGCSVTPMRMNTVVEPGQVRKVEKVLIVTNGRLFPDSTKQMFFDPLVESAMQMLQVHGVKSWQMEVPKQTLNPAEQMMAYARQLGASHVLHVAATSVASFGPRNSPVEYSKQQRLISSYELGFILIDVETKRYVWKGDLKSGTDYKGNEEEIEAVRSRLEEGLIQAGFLLRSSAAQSAFKDLRISGKPRKIVDTHFFNDKINTRQLWAQSENNRSWRLVA